MDMYVKETYLSVKETYLLVKETTHEGRDLPINEATGIWAECSCI